MISNIVIYFSGQVTSHHVIDLPRTVTLSKWPIDQSIPADLAPRLFKMFDEPFAWWMGQLQKFYAKPLPKIEKMIDDVIQEYNLPSTFTCVHVRRSEKISEAAYISLNTYMSFVKEYFDQLDIKIPNTPRHVFLASDDPQVFLEARRNFTNYKFTTNDKAASMVHLLENREGLSYMALTNADFKVLSKCDFTVVTYSSNYGRRIYEMKYNFFRDAIERIVSLDSPYFVYIQNRREYKVVFRHKSRRPKMTLKIGDKVVSSKFWRNLNNDGCIFVHFRNVYFYVPTYKLELVTRTIVTPS